MKVSKSIPKGWFCRHAMQKKYPDGTHVCIFCGARGYGTIPDPTIEMKNVT
jgi:hypothetical protein